MNWYGDTEYDSWGIWAINVYANQRHFMLGMAVILILIILFLPNLRRMSIALSRENDFKGFINNLVRAVEHGDVPISRVDDAVRRILSVKQRLGLFDQPNPGADLLDSVGGEEHRALALEAVRKSAVLLKNEGAALPLRSDVPCIRLAGSAADDIGLQCGGWTIEWQGKIGAITTGTTLRSALRNALPDSVTLDFQPDATFDQYKAPVGVVVIAEKPYAEGCGDVSDLTITAADLDLIQKTRAACERLVLVIYSGRPLIITEALPLCDAIVAAWLPGSEGDGLADLLLGEVPFEGKLPQDWIASMEQLPASVRISSGQAPLYPFGYGL